MDYTYKVRIMFDYKKENTWTEFVLFVDGLETDVRAKGPSEFCKKLAELGIELNCKNKDAGKTTKEGKHAQLLQRP